MSIGSRVESYFVGYSWVGKSEMPYKTRVTSDRTARYIEPSHTVPILNHKVRNGVGAHVTGVNRSAIDLIDVSQVNLRPVWSIGVGSNPTISFCSRAIHRSRAHILIVYRVNHDTFLIRHIGLNWRWSCCRSRRGCR